jgi:hypothetical protein
MPSNSKKMRNNEASRTDAKSETMVPTHTREKVKWTMTACVLNYYNPYKRKVLHPDGWGSRVAPRGLGFDPLVGRILGIVKKIPSVCLVRSRIPSPARHPPAWAIAEWAVVAVPLVMGGQCSRVFSTRTYWFRDFLAISGLCAPWVPALGDVGEGGFLLPGRVFFITTLIIITISFFLKQVKRRFINNWGTVNASRIRSTCKVPLYTTYVHISELVLESLQVRLKFWKLLRSIRQISESYSETCIHVNMNWPGRITFTSETNTIHCLMSIVVNPQTRLPFPK